MPRARRSASTIASSSLAYFQKRVPPRAGPRTVEWIAMMPRYPAAGSWHMTSCSWPIELIVSKIFILIGWLFRVELAGDHDPLDLRRAFINLGDLGVPEQAF